jgi:4-hydroxy 2-oxovalerate aldolase
MESTFTEGIPVNILGVLPPFPRKMGTYIPDFLKNRAFELSDIRFKGPAAENVTATVLELCYSLSPTGVKMIGYDGYTGDVTENQMELFNENQVLLNEVRDLGIVSFTPTQYKNIDQSSIYRFD